MALYQPTNAIPSSYTKGTVDAVNDKMEISWQVNGNSAMTAFQIDFYLNDANSTYVTTTGRLTDNIPTGGFYGTDRFGRPQFFTWNANGQSWEEWSKYQLTNGNEYKYKITQWYKGEVEVAHINGTGAMLVGATYYFQVADKGIISFIPTSFNVNSMSGGTFYYDFINKKGWYVSLDGALNQILMTESSSVGGGWIAVNSTENTVTIDNSINETFIQQTSTSVFITRDKPTLTIYQSDEKYVDEIDFPNGGSIATSIGFFKAKYKQEQDDPIRWIRWQVATATYNKQTQKWVLGDILQDTGDIYTPTLNYEYNGFFNGQQYAIRALGESESGQECNSNSASEGWIYFTIAIENQGQYDGNFNVQCLNKENATLLGWEGIEIIPPTVSPQGYEPQISNGSVTLNGKNGDTEYSVAWNKQGTESMNFSAPWTAVWKGDIKKTKKDIGEILTGIDAKSQVNLTQVNTLSFDRTGALLVVGGNFNGYAKLYRVNSTDNQMNFISNIIDNTDPDAPSQLSQEVIVSEFSPNNKVLLLADNDYIIIFSRDGEKINCEGYIEGTEDTDRSFSPTCLKFSLDGSLLVAGRKTGSFSSIFSVNGTSINFIGSINKNGSALDGAVNAVAFLGNYLIIGGEFTGKCTVYSVDGTNLSYLKDIKLDDVSITETINAINISPQGNVMVLCGNTQCYIFSVDESNFTYVSSINGGGIVADFSANGKFFARANGNTNSIVEAYTVNDTKLTLLNMPIPLNVGKWGKINDLKFSPYVEQLVLGGYPASVGFAITQLTVLAPTYEHVYEEVYIPQGQFFKLSADFLSLIRTTDNNDRIILKNGTTELATLSVPINSETGAICITPTTIYAYFYNTNGLISQSSIPITYTPQPISSVSIYGGDSGATVDSVSVYQGDGLNILSLYENPDFEPVWNNDQYKLYMTANFNGNLEGGTGTATGKGFRVYRQEVGKNVLTPIATVPSTTTSIKDYGIVSRKAYKYSLYAYDNNGAFMSAVENEKVVATCFKNYSLLVCDYDEENDEYHVRKQYLFALNLSTGSVGNNNSPTLNANFTRYPTRMPSTQNYASGTLQGLIGAIYTVPALIEQIGNYKWTAKPSTLDYFDSVDLEQELYDLSTAPYQLFLRDMKGRLRMVATNGAITMTTNIKQKQQSIYISFPWVEIGDASDVTIIQTPDDYGWNNDNQVLDVSLDADVETGELSATYPYPYNGTKFYLTGVNKETLTAKTPLGITPAQFELSETATQPDDGELTATVKVNSEDN